MTENPSWTRLKKTVGEMIGNFPGKAGFYMQELKSSNRFGFNASEVFTAASTIKIPILIQLLQKGYSGQIDLQGKVLITPEMHVPGSGVLSQLDHSVELSILDLANLMIIVSDNTATNLCIDLAGIPETNQLMRELGLENTSLKRKMLDTEAMARGEENTSTPFEMASLMQKLHLGLPSPKVAEHCLKILRKPNNGPLKRALPGVSVANKSGELEGIRCDVGLVDLPENPYVIALMSAKSKASPIEQEQALVDIFRAIQHSLS